jgi:hypothetical protein
MAPDQLEQLQKIATGPTREEVEPILRSDVMRKYRIDIESDSTIRGDLTRNQQTMNLFLQGTGQFMTALAPMIQLTPEALEPAVEVYTAFARQFKLGKQAEDALDKLAETARKAGQAAGQEKPDPEAEKLKAQMAQQAQQHEQKLQQADQQHKQTLEQQGQQFAQKQQQDADQHAQKMQELEAQHRRTLEQTETHHALSSVAEEDRHKRTLEAGDKQFEQKQKSDNDNHERNRAASKEDRHLDREDRKSEREANDKSAAIEHLAKGMADRESRGEPEVLKAQAKHAEQLAAALAKLDAMVSDLTEELKAPVELIRDAKGVAMGIRKGKRESSVVRDHNGSALGLQ